MDWITTLSAAFGFPVSFGLGPAVTGDHYAKS
jgi:hypothetical protein